MTPRILGRLALLAALAAAGPLRAADVYVPDDLEPWRAWVLGEHPEQACPPVYADATVRPCVWTSRLGLDAAPDGVRFAMDVELFAPADVVLPGGAGYWPADVQVAAETGAGRPATVTQAGGQPRLRLDPGRYSVTGRIDWSRMPDALAVPRRHGLLLLTVDGRPVVQPFVEGDRLWLGRGGAPAAAAADDTLEARVYRRVDDGVPLTVATTLELAVGGSHRIETLGRALPEGFAVTGLESPLPARVDPDGNLRVQVEPGNWRIRLDARALTPVDALRATAATDNWPAQEVWGFAAARGLRVVAIEGAAPVDLAQTGAPFQELPGYLMTPASEFRLVEQFRGDPNPTPDDYRLVRNAWLGFAGDTLVLEDRIELTAARPARLAATFVPGRIDLDGVPQLVTSLGDGAPGIELPQGRHVVLAVSEVGRDALVTVPGWRIDAASVETTLHLPPAWRLLWTSGVDGASTAWLAQWNVWNLFLVMVTVFAAARLLGIASAVLAAVTLAIVYHEPGAPTYAWIVMLVLLAGIRLLRPGALRQVLGLLYFAVLLVTLGATVGFAIDGFRKAIYPQLERPDEAVADFAAPARYEAQSIQYEKLLRDGAAGGEAEIAIASETVGEQRAPDLQMLPAPAPAAAPPPPSPPLRDRYPTDLRVQTGPAVPQWRWTAAPLHWDGPVTADQTFSFTLSPPWLTRALYVAGPVLLLALFGVFALANLPPSMRLPGALARFARSSGGVATPAALLAALAVLPGALQPASAHAASYPGPELLGELEQRLTAPPDCMPGCAQVERVAVRLDRDTLAVELVVHADVPVAVPVLRADEAWQPVGFQADGRQATVTRDDDGRLLVAVSAGRHTLTVAAPVRHLERFELNFPTPPGQVRVDAQGWEVYGMEEGRLRGASLQFAREAQSGAGRESASLRSDPVAPYYAVERELRFGIQWRAVTTIRRMAPPTGVIPFSVPLLPGESVLSGQVNVTGGTVTGVLAPSQQEQRYESALAEAATLALTAPALDLATERWTLVPSNLWHVEHQGVPPVKTAPGESAGPRFQPLPGETLTVTPTRPAAVPGDSITVERVQLSEDPGRRTRRSELTLSLLSSQGGVFPVTLPPDARILEIRAGGRPEPIPAATGPIPLPVIPGVQEVALVWETPTPVEFRTATSTPALPAIARNVNLALSLPEDRWPLLVGGPALGPAVTWWSILLLVLLVAAALARVPGLPLRTHDALLAGVGLSLCNLPGAVVTGVWLLVMLARRRAAARLAFVSRRAFNAMQVLLGLFSVVAVLMLAASVPFGLLGAPEMYVDGNGSWAHSLRWFQDQAVGDLPVAWVVSLPIWVYRLAMLAWSLWLAFALVRWVRWAWESCGTGGAWRRRGEPAPGSGDLWAPPVTGEP